MVAAVLLLAVAVLALAGVMAYGIRSRRTTGTVSSGVDDRLPDGAAVIAHVGNIPEGSPSARRPTDDLRLRELDGLETNSSRELLLGDLPLMVLERHSAPPAQILKGTFANWLSILVENEAVMQFIGGQRWVLAKVPIQIGRGAEWVRSGDSIKAAARASDTGQVIGFAEIVAGGATLGTAVALAPAVIGATAGAVAYHRLAVALSRIEKRVTDHERLLIAADVGAIEGAEDLIGQLDEWGPAERWPQQLLFELAVRRAALDPVVHSHRERVNNLVNDLTNRQHDKDLSTQLLAEVDVRLRASIAKAQLDIATSLVLLATPAAPFGLRRLTDRSAAFADEVEELFGALEPLGASIEQRLRKRVRNTVMRRDYSALAEGVSEKIGELRTISEQARGKDAGGVVLSVEAGELVVGLPASESEEALDEEAELMDDRDSGQSTGGQAVGEPKLLD